MNTDISNALNMVPLDNVEDKPLVTIQQSSTSQIDDDFEYARGNLIAAIEKGQEALTGIVDVATMGQHPRAYEVVATLIKSVSDANKDLLELQKRKKELKGETAPTSINNNLFVGSTADLQKLLSRKADE